MSERKRAIVVTTINAPTKAMHELSRGALASGDDIIVVGDTKTPAQFALPGCRFLPIDDQVRLFPDLCSPATLPPLLVLALALAAGAPERVQALSACRRCPAQSPRSLGCSPGERQCTLCSDGQCSRRPQEPIRSRIALAR